jgi:tetratricopeptide (TPR) repeat protein
VALNDKFETGYFGMAAMLGNLKRFDEAIATLKKLLEINPEYQEAQRMLQQITAERR